MRLFWPCASASAGMLGVRLLLAGRAGSQHVSPGFRAGNQQATSPEDNTQQAMHIFFQKYSKDHTDELANTCVLLICNGLSAGSLCWDQSTGVLCAADGHMAVQQAQAVHLQCKFLICLFRQSNLPTEAVCDAVCANNLRLGIQPEAVRNWLQSM